jgi:hypothetical protein
MTMYRVYQNIGLSDTSEEPCTDVCPAKHVSELDETYSCVSKGICRLGGEMVSVLAIRPKVREFKPGLIDGILRAIKIRSTPSFGREVKQSASCRKILRHVKYHLNI